MTEQPPGPPAASEPRPDSAVGPGVDAPARRRRTPFIVAAIVLIVAIVVTIVVVMSVDSTGGATPQAAVDSYISAAQNNDRSKASDYVCEFIRPLIQHAGTGDLFYDGTGQHIVSWTIGEVTQTTQSAQVSVAVTLGTDDGGSQVRDVHYHLVMEQGGWVIC